MRWGPLWAALIALAAWGCGEDGDQPRAGWTSFEPAGGEYRLSYLEPPWEEGSPTAGTQLTLRIQSNAERFVPDAAPFIPPKYRLEVNVEGGNAEDRIEQAERQLRREETITVEPRPVTTDSGDEGWELLSRFAIDGVPRQRRVVFLDRSGGGVVSLRFEANPDLDEPQIDVMVQGVVVDPGS